MLTMASLVQALGSLFNLIIYLDDGVGEEEDNSDILGAVGGEEEGNSGSFDDISQSGLDLVVQVTFVVDSLGFLDQTDKLSLGVEVVLILSGLWVYLLQKLQLLLNLGLNLLHLGNLALILSDDVLDLSEGVSHGDDSEGDHNNDEGFGHSYDLLSK